MVTKVIGDTSNSIRKLSSGPKGLDAQSLSAVNDQAGLIVDQSDLANATADFAKSTLANQTAHGVAGKLLSLAKTVVQGYLGAA